MHSLRDPPGSGGREGGQRARVFHSVAVAVLLTGSFLLLAVMAMDTGFTPRGLGALAVLIVLCLGLIELNRRGRVRLASILLVAGLGILVTSLALQAGGIRFPGITLYPILVLLAGVLLGPRAGLVTGGVLAATGFALTLAEELGWLGAPTVRYAPLTVWFLNCLFIVMVISLLGLATRGIRKALASAESELRERGAAEERLQLALDAGGIGVWDHDLRKGCMRGDPRLFELYGAAPTADGAAPVEVWRSPIHPEDLPSVEQVIRELSERVERRRIQFRVVRPEGEVRHLEGWGTSVAGQDGRPVRIVGMVVDATRRREAEEERDRLVGSLKERVKELRLLHASARMLQGTRPFDRTILEELVALLPPAWQHAECCEARIAYGDLQVTTPGWRESPWRQSASFRTREGIGVVEVLYTEEQPEADEGPFLAEERDLLDSLAESLAGYLERQRAERERRNLESQLRQAQKMEALGTLAGGIAHDFNNILAAILANAELGLSEIYPDRPEREVLAEISRAASRARELVRRILVFSQRQEMERVPVEAASAVGEAVRLLRSTLPPGVEIEVAAGEDLPPILASPTQLQQVILNLATNAFHAMRDRGGKLTLEMHRVVVEDPASAPSADLRPGEHVCISVRDTGVGMSPEIVERIFEPFFTTKGQEGTGLGLSIVHGIVRDHDGAVTVESQVGKGSVFRVYLPIAVGSGIAGTSTALRTIRGNGEHIAYVDDESALVFVMTRVLEHLGYRSTGFTDPREALQAFRAAPGEFDGVITDLAMPGLNGLDLVRELRTLRRDLPVALASGFRSDPERIREAGIRIVINKPATLEELGEALSRMFREGREGSREG